jgi:hypothetical protein
LEVKRLAVESAYPLVFENDIPSRRDVFYREVTTKLSLIQAQQGIEEFDVIVDNRVNTDEDRALNKLNGRIEVVPTRTAENFALDFIITNSGVTFA